MSGRAMRVIVGVVCPLVLIQAVVQHLQRGAGWEDTMPLWPDDRTAQILAIALLSVAVALVVGYAARPKPEETAASYPGLVAGGFPPTVPLLIPLFALAVLVMEYSPAFDSVDSTEKALVAAMVAALAVWVVAAIWRGLRSTAREAAPALYERLRTDYLALETMVRRLLDPAPRSGVSAARGALGTGTSVPTPANAPLAAAEISAYLGDIGRAIGFEENPVRGRAPAVSTWNTGSGYLEMQRRLDYVRDSLIALEDDKQSLDAYASVLELRLAGSHLPEANRTMLRQQLDLERARFLAGASDPTIRGSGLYVVAATLSSYTYDRQRALLQLQSQQHWLVVLAQVIAGGILAIAVLAGASREAIAAAIVFFLVGAASGILSLLQVRQSGVEVDLGEDYGLFRVELARAFTLSGMAAVMAVLLIANLPVLAGAGVFDPPAVTETPEPPDAGSTPSGIATVVSDDASGSEGEQPVRAYRANLYEPVAATRDQDTTIQAPARFQDAAERADPGGDAGDELDSPQWRPLRDIYAFTNLGGLLVALVAGWVPERLFRTLTDYGNRLRLDIQSVSRASS